MEKIKCSKCKYEWEYKGKHPSNATCPHCGLKANKEKK